MSDVNVRASLQIRVAANVAFDYQSRPTSYSADFNTKTPKGPTPGAVTVGVSHTVISLAQLTTPGMLFVQNLDATNFVEIGTYHATLGIFVPFLELLPGEFTVLRLSRFLGADLDTGTGTGTADSNVVQLAAKADVAPCVVRFDVFER